MTAILRELPRRVSIGVEADPEIGVQPPANEPRGNGLEDAAEHEPAAGGDAHAAPRRSEVRTDLGSRRPTIPRLFSALARKLMVCGVYSAGTTGLGRRARK